MMISLPFDQAAIIKVLDLVYPFLLYSIIIKGFALTAKPLIIMPCTWLRKYSPSVT